MTRQTIKLAALMMFMLIPATMFGQFRLQRVDVQLGHATNFNGSGFSVFKDTPVLQHAPMDYIRLGFGKGSSAEMGLSTGFANNRLDYYNEYFAAFTLGVDFRSYIELLPALQGYYFAGLDLAGLFNSYTLAKDDNCFRIGADVRLGVGLELKFSNLWSMGLNYGIISGSLFNSGYKPDSTMPDKGDKQFYMSCLSIDLGIKF